ncbi:hypothetical protein ACFLYW_00795 [Thermodesulfobacteriota bacterium]
MGKHEGHAVEAVVKGICEWICNSYYPKYDVVRGIDDLPLTMDTDVIVRKKDQIQALIIVCHADNPDYSHRKVKRSHQEFVEGLNLLLTDKDKILTPNYRIINFVFGMPNGWADGQLSKMKKIMAPTIFYPELVTPEDFNDFITVSMEKYWEVKTKRTDRLARIVAKDPSIIPTSKILIKCLKRMVFNPSVKNNLEILESIKTRTKILKKTASKKYSTPLPFNTRYRQGLSMLAVFSPKERAILFNLLNKRIAPKDLTLSELNTIRRGQWLGYFSYKKGISTKIMLSPKRRENCFTPDFSQPFDSLSFMKSNNIINNLDKYAMKNTNTFIGGIQCLSIGNFIDVIKQVLPVAYILIDIIKGRTSKKKDFQYLLSNDLELIPSSGRWSGPNKNFMILRSWVVSLLATLKENTSLLSKKHFDFGSNNGLNSTEQGKILSEILSINKKTIITELNNTILFCENLLSDDFYKIINSTPPITFSLTPGSWYQRLYFVLSSHAAYNPLMEILYTEIVTKRHEKKKICGFPNTLAVSLSKILGKAVSGRYRIIVQESKVIHIYEALSITSNNIGNKSKELFDRIGIAKRAAAKEGKTIEFHGLFDGDFDPQTIKEFSTGDRYNEFLSIVDFV